MRLDFRGNEAEISLYLDPDLTGIGLGKSMLAAAQHRIALASSGNRVIAEVRAENEASQAAFRAAGFARSDSLRWQWEARP